MKISSLMDLVNVMDSMKHYLNGKIGFDSKGWPLFTKEHFLNIWPSQVITFQNRKNKMIKHADQTLLCFFMSDSLIYPRFSKILDEIDEYRQYLGVVASDITVTDDMDIELQESIMLANQLFMAVLAVNNIKVVMNTRSGLPQTDSCLDNIPKGVMCASGLLGCSKADDYFSASGYVDKILRLRPSKLVLYGKKDAITENALDTVGISYRRYDDFRTISERRSKNEL